MVNNLKKLDQTFNTRLLTLLSLYKYHQINPDKVSNTRSYSCRKICRNITNVISTALYQKWLINGYSTRYTDCLWYCCDNKLAKLTIYKGSSTSFKMVKPWQNETQHSILASYLCWFFDVWKSKMTGNEIDLRIMKREEQKYSFEFYIISDIKIYWLKILIKIIH